MRTMNDLPTEIILCISKYLNHKAIINLGRSDKHYAAIFSLYKNDIIQNMLKYHGFYDLYYGDKNGNSCIPTCIPTFIIKYIEHHNPGIIKILPNIIKGTPSNMEILSCVIFTFKYSDTSLLQLLLIKYLPAINKNVYSYNNTITFTLLELSIQYEKPIIVEFLIRRGAHITNQAIELCIRRNNIELCILLHHHLKDNHTFLQKIKCHANATLVEKFFNIKPPVLQTHTKFILHKCVNTHDYVLLKKMIDYNMNIIDITMDNNILLQNAVDNYSRYGYQAQKNIIQLLIENGADTTVLNTEQLIITQS
jgi:hypothetical protein